MDLPHIAIIPDGNRRWAKARNLPTVAGHKAGAEKLQEAREWAEARGIRYLTFYALSTENWSRSQEEIGYLMRIIEEKLAEWARTASKEPVRIRFIGERGHFSASVQGQLEKIERDTETFDKFNLAIALSYGGRAEIISAIKSLPLQHMHSLTEETFSQHLWTAGIPDPDLVLRTGGFQRLSNFLPWQSAYSELYFTPTLWPDLTQEEFNRAVDFFIETKRNFGR
ncbi:MAG: polyprenyl diphosphate synthase [Patescibacteria group bacterium]